MPQTFEREVGGRQLSIEHGRVALQADGSVVVRLGETMGLATAVMSPEARDIDFFPRPRWTYEGAALTPPVRSRGASSGAKAARPPRRGPQRAASPDRPLRPLFPKGFRNDVDMILTVLSADQENDPDILALVGASTAVSISPIPSANRWAPPASDTSTANTS